MTTLGTYAKAVVGAVTAALTAAITALADGDITNIEWTIIAGAFLVSAGAIFAIPNLPSGVRKYGKAIVAGLITVAASLGQALTDGGISSAEWLGILIALASGAGLVGTTPNAEESDQFSLARRALIDPV